MNIEDKVSLVVTVRASEVIIIKFIEYHLSRGIDEIYLFLDDPEYNINFSFKDDRVFVFNCNFNYWKKTI